MMRKRGLCLLLLVLLMLNAVGNISGQEDGNKSLIYVYPDRDCEQHFTDVLEQVRENLKKYDYDIVALSQPDIKTSSLYDFDADVIQIHFDMCLFDDTTIALGLCLSQAVNPMQALSPTLMSYPIGCGILAEATFPKDSLAGKDLAANYLTALSLYTANRCNEAVPYFEQVQEAISTLNLEWQDVRAPLSVPFYRANCSLKEKDYQQAIELYQSILIDFPNPFFYTDSLSSAINLSWAYLQIGQEKEALTLIDKVVFSSQYWARVSPFWEFLPVITIPKRAQLYALIGHYSDSIVDLTDLIEYFSHLDKEPNISDLTLIYLLRGQAYLALYEWDSALADYNAALELAPDYADAYFYRGLLYYSILQTGTDLRDDALADFRRYLELAPTGSHADDAARSIETIQAELDALND